MDDLYDVVIVGGGPAGLTAAIYLARAKFRVIVLEKEQFGGQIAITEDVVNYPGIEHINGKVLAENMRNQAQSFGSEFKIAEVTGFDAKDKIKIVHSSQGDLRCLGILIATGASPRTVGFKGEEEYKGRGVAYCATCDGEFFTDKEIFVIGGGYAAAEESVFLTKFARHITILVREEDFTCAPTVADKAKNHEKITVLFNTQMEEVSGNSNGLNYAGYLNTQTGEKTEYKAKDGETFGVFVFAGYKPSTEFLKNTVKLNEQGYIITDNSARTQTEGVYAAGDVCIKPLRQVVTATSDGALAATELEKYVSELQRKYGLFSQPTKNHNNSGDRSVTVSTDVEKEKIFSHETVEQLKEVFIKMERKLLLKLSLDNRRVSKELEAYITELAETTDRISVKIYKKNANSDIAPCVEIYLDDNTPTGLAFHGVPSGHEFSSFVLGLYNAAGPGQFLDDSVKQRISAIVSPLDIKVLVTLSCTMCPDLVTAAQHIAAINPNVTANIYDIHYFDSLRKQYNVMSVPCLIINDNKVSFGKKNINQLLDFIENNAD